MRPRIRSHVSIFIFFVIALVGHVACLAQDTTQIEIQDGVFVSRAINHGADTLPLDVNIAAAYIFEMLYDSTCRVQYTFTECRINGIRPRLATWKFHRLVTASLSALTDSSRTDPFKVVTGDTVSFYRELMWYDPKTGRQDTNNFFSPDTLDYVVELVRRSTGRRVAMLDSVGVLARGTPGRPVLYGMRPILAKVRYPVPASLDGDTVFVRVRLYARGSGEFNPVRGDRTGLRLSDKLEDPFWKAYLATYGGALGRRTFDASGAMAGTENGASGLVVRQVEPGLIRIGLPASIRGRSASVVIYNMAGQPIFIPYASEAAVGEEITYRFESSGVYYVVLAVDGTPVFTRTIAIPK